MILSIIVAHGKNLEIGKDNQLLWRLSSDLKRFKKITMGHTLIMGRKTYESIGRPLPGRKMIVISRSQNTSQSDNLFWVNSLEDAVKLAEEMKESEAFVIGGGEIYQLSLNKVQKFYISEVEFEGEADTLFPKYSHLNFKVITEEYNIQNDKDQYPYHYKELALI